MQWCPLSTESWILTAEPAQVGRARRLVDGFAAAQGVDEPTRNAVMLAISEAVTNAVLHGFPDGAGDSEIRLRATHEAASFELVVEDNGTGMRSRTDSPGAGYGLRIIRSLATAVETADRPPPGGLSVRIRFAVAG